MYVWEGTEVAIVYLDDHDDARETNDRVEAEEEPGLLICVNVGSKSFCAEALGKPVDVLGGCCVILSYADS